MMQDAYALHTSQDHLYMHPLVVSFFFSVVQILQMKPLIFEQAMLATYIFVY